jgi:hypothetical protein
MATPKKKSSSPKSPSKTARKSPKVKDLSPRKDVRGGNTDHSPPGGGNKNDY